MWPEVELRDLCTGPRRLLSKPETYGISLDGVTDQHLVEGLALCVQVHDSVLRRLAGFIHYR